jgi:hypothetical protein
VIVCKHVRIVAGGRGSEWTSRFCTNPSKQTSTSLVSRSRTTCFTVRSSDDVAFVAILTSFCHLCIHHGFCGRRLRSVLSAACSLRSARSLGSVSTPASTVSSVAAAAVESVSVLCAARSNTPRIKNKQLPAPFKKPTGN